LPIFLPEVPSRLPLDALAHCTRGQEETKSGTRGKRALACNLLQNAQGQNRPKPGNRWQPREPLDSVRFGTARAIEFDFAQPLVILIAERTVAFDRLADTGSGAMLRHIFSLRFVRQSLAELRQIVLTIGIVKVR
jgi:hypothetical protein